MYEAYYKELGNTGGSDFLWKSLIECETGVFENFGYDTIEFMRNILNCTVAEKYGGTGKCYHHAGIVMREKPYVLVLLTENRLGDTKPQWTREMILLLDEIMTEYQKSR